MPEKGLAVRDEAKRYIEAYGEYDKIPPSFITLREELGEKILASPNVRAAAAAHVSRYEIPLQEFQVGTTSAPMKYQKTSLKEAILKSDDRSLEPYKRIIQIMDLGEAKIKDLLQKTSGETVQKILFIYEKTGRIFEDFLFIDLDAKQIQLLDNITRYYRLLEDGTVLKCLEKRKDIQPLEYFVEIDREKFSSRLWAFLDVEPLPLDLYMGKFGEYGEPVIGTLYRQWPCYNALQQQIEKEYRESLPSLNFQEAVNKISQLKEKYDMLEGYRNELIRFELIHWIYFPIRYAKRNGLLNGAYLYVNRVSRPLPCPFCGKRHSYIFIAEVRKK